MHTLYLFSTALALITMLATGCAGHEHRLNPVNSASDVSGKMIHGNISTPDRLIVKTADKHFEGDLVVKTYVEWEKVRKAYGSDSRHWERITSGLDNDHQTSAGTAEMKSIEGEMMRCKLVWSRPGRPAGECIDQAGVSLMINFD